MIIYSAGSSSSDYIITTFVLDFFEDFEFFEVSKMPGLQKRRIDSTTTLRSIVKFPCLGCFKFFELYSFFFYVTISFSFFFGIYIFAFLESDCSNLDFMNPLIKV